MRTQVQQDLDVTHWAYDARADLVHEQRRVLRTFVVNCLAVHGKVFEQLALIHALAS